MNTHERPLTDQLNKLPPLVPPPALWRSIENELDQRQASQRHRRWTWISASMAAVIVLAVVIGLVRQPEIRIPAQADIDPALVEARQLSSLLEAQLRLQHFGVVNTASVESLVWLENELGWLDMRLASDPNNLELWQRRSELLSEMNRLYGQSSWQAQMRLTSL